MNTINFSAADLKNAIDQSVRGKIFSFIMNTIICSLAIILLLIASAFMYSRNDVGLVVGLSVMVGPIAGIIVSGYLYFEDGCSILSLSTFGFKPTQRDLQGYSRKTDNERLKEIDELLTELSEEKQQIQARLG